MKIKTKILITLSIIWILVLPLLLLASPKRLAQSGDVYLKARQLDWNTYYFEPRENNVNGEPLSYLWEFSDGYSYTGREFIRTFDAGNYDVRLTAVDYYGRYYTQTAVLKVKYLSLANKWFWGFFFLGIMILIVYYWLAKLIYKANRKIIDKEIEAFTEGLEEADFWKNLVKAIKSTK